MGTRRGGVEMAQGFDAGIAHVDGAGPPLAP